VVHCGRHDFNGDHRSLWVYAPMTLNTYLFAFNEWRNVVRRLKQDPTLMNSKLAVYWQMQFVLCRALYKVSISV
jgi:hypothetical protein